MGRKYLPLFGEFLKALRIGFMFFEPYAAYLRIVPLNPPGCVRMEIAKPGYLEYFAKGRGRKKSDVFLVWWEHGSQSPITETLGHIDQIFCEGEQVASFHIDVSKNSIERIV
jgi:hypothetical protein